jgi:DNA-binding NarL/FixJ family response regulator
VRTALIVEKQPFIVPFLRHALERSGHVTFVARSVSGVALERLRPDTVLIGVHGLTKAPLATIRAARAARSDARIVAIVDRHDEAWNAVAEALGADAILGPSCDGRTLALVLSHSSTGLQENFLLRRTS